jgi:hypothetical protein
VKAEEIGVFQKFKGALTTGVKYAEYGEFVGIGSAIVLVSPFFSKVRPPLRGLIILGPFVPSLCKIGLSTLLFGCDLLNKEEKKDIWDFSSLQKRGASLLPSSPCLIHLCGVLIRLFMETTLQVKAHNFGHCHIINDDLNDDPSDPFLKGINLFNQKKEGWKFVSTVPRAVWEKGLFFWL